MANITDKKLYAPIQNVQFSNRDYIEKAKQIAKKIVEYDPEGTMSEYHIKKELKPLKMLLMCEIKRARIEIF